MQHWSKTSSCAENVLFSKRKEKKRSTETAWPRIPSHIASTSAASAFFSTVAAREAAPSYMYPQSPVFLQQQKKILKNAALLEKVLICRESSLSQKKKKKKRKNETWRPRPHILSHIASAAACAFFLLLQREKREKLPFGPLLASPRFSLQLQDFAAVPMGTAALRVQKAKSCSRVTRALRMPATIEVSLGWYWLDDSYVIPHVRNSEAGAHRVWDGTILVANGSTHDHCRPTRQASLFQWCNVKSYRGASGAPSNSLLALFEKVGFRATTPSPVIVRATFSRQIYLLFLILFLWKYSEKNCHLSFFIPFQRLVAMKQSQDALKNTCFCTFRNI